MTLIADELFCGGQWRRQRGRQANYLHAHLQYEVNARQPKDKALEIALHFENLLMVKQSRTKSVTAFVTSPNLLPSHGDQRIQTLEKEIDELKQNRNRTPTPRNFEKKVVFQTSEQPQSIVLATMTQDVQEETTTHSKLSTLPPKTTIQVKMPVQ